MDEAAPDNNKIILFGSFRVDRARRLVERNGQPITLGGRAYDILAYLLERAGEVVSKEELLRKVWPTTLVEEGSLRFHINSLRKALGEGRYITNIARQGYSFVAPVSRPPIEPVSGPRSSLRALPPRPRRLLGRDQALRAISQQLLKHRFITLVGPGGIGKTSVALALMHDLASQFDGDICFFDVGGVRNSELLAGGLASALGIAKQPAGPTPGITTFLRQRRMLLVLDGCEAHVETAAVLAEQIFGETTDVHLLVTSRESLRVEGEHIHRLLPLDTPAPDAGQSAAGALGFTAVEFFVERAASSLNGFVLTDEDAPIVSAICRKLDGLALAIELAAGRIGAYEVREVARQLDGQVALTWPARRTAAPRHQTLSATIGWSYQLLPAPEQAVFRRLGVFAGAFTLDMAAQLIADEGLSEAVATQLLGSLVSKSLVQFNRDRKQGAYRLLDTTRSYARERGREAGEARDIAERHAGLVLRLLKEGSARRSEDDMRRCGEILDDVGVAIEWALSEDGDIELGAALAEASAPFWLWAGLLVECSFWLKRVLECAGPSRLAASQRLSIQAAIASAETFTEGFTESSISSWLECLEIAKSIDNIEHQLTCLIVLWAFAIRGPDYGGAWSLARQVAALTAPIPDPGLRAISDWITGITQHHTGDLTAARISLGQALGGDTLAARQGMLMQFGYDRRIPTMGVLSNLYWLEGKAEQSRHLAGQAVAEARHSPYPVPLCEALTWQALNLYLCGDHPLQIDALLNEAIDHSKRHFIESYIGLALSLKGLNAIRADREGEAMVLEGMGLLSKAKYEVFHPFFHTEFARLRTQRGFVPHDEEVQALIRLQAMAVDDWSAAEVRRNLGEILLAKGETVAGRKLLCDAVDCARRQGALAWELRAMLSFARASDASSSSVVKAELKACLGRFTEGRDTADVREALQFLQ